MKRFTKLLILVLLPLAACFNQRPDLSCPTYREADDPSPIINEVWDVTGRGLHASFGSTDLRYAKHEVPMQAVTKDLSFMAWKGEKLSAQAVLWSVDSVHQVECEMSEVKSREGYIIPAENIQTRFVRYVLTDEFAGGCGYRQAVNFDSSLVADALDPVICMDMPRRSVRPVWLSIKIPQNAPVGQYSGSLKIYSKKNPPQELRFSINVLDRTLPSSDQWGFHLDLWQNPFAIARWYNVEPWSDDHFKVMKPYFELLAEAGQKCITTSIMHHPWNSQTFDPFLSMVKWTKQSNGTWKYDYSVFDRWVEFARECGIGEQINCYTMVPWGNNFQYYDEKIDEVVKVNAEPGTSAYEKLWKPFLTDFVGHLKEKGWFEHATIAMDERPEKAMVEVIKLIKSVEPDLKVSLAANHWIPEIMDDIHDLCVASEFNYTSEMKRKRKQAGKITTYYTCCSENYPNTFTFSPPAESAWLGWYAAAMDLDGYLRWAYNSWVKNPLVDSRFRAWPAGDTYFVYPGAMSSIRFERLVEGIQDFEKIQILKCDLENDTSEQAKAKLAFLNEKLGGFKMDRIPGETAAAMVNKGRDILNAISVD